jgi:hypothetical protein
MQCKTRVTNTTTSCENANDNQCFVSKKAGKTIRHITDRDVEMLTSAKATYRTRMTFLARASTRNASLKWHISSVIDHGISPIIIGTHFECTLPLFPLVAIDTNVEILL